MRLLVVEGNSREIWEKREVCGGTPYHKRFLSMLKILQPNAKVEIAFPADHDSNLPTIENLQKFDGILWTGSSLFVNDPSPAVARQLTLAEDVFSSGVPFYGSCWGMQIAVVVAGGKVNKCKNGREFGITKPIELTKAGKNHPCFKGRGGKFSALSIHLDEVVKLPENSTILAKNDHSEVQALSIRYRNSEFFGVQYHPEFMVLDMAFFTRLMSKKLVEEGFFKFDEDVENFAIKLEKKNGSPKSVFNYPEHIQEVKFWLDRL
jgi:GMP synthase (glutamine-hydrolysing)